MSSSGHLNERTIKAVLMALWQRPETTLQALLRETLAPQPEVLGALEVLRQRRCLIERTPTGIALVSTGLACWSDVLEEEARRARRTLGRRVMVFLRTGSTNDIAWQCAAGSRAETDGLVVVADEQSAGRGRLGHTWSAKAEQSILMSVLLQGMPQSAAEGEGTDRLTLLAGLATARAIEESLERAGMGGRMEIKWPNDLLIGGKKVAGILVERRPARGAGAAGGGPVTVIGIGINVTQTAADFSVEIAQRATSLYAAMGKRIDRLRIVSGLMGWLEHYLLDPGLSEGWIDEWKSRCSMLGTRVNVHTAGRGRRGGLGGGAGEGAGESGGEVLSGEVLDVAPLQGLVLRDDQGGTHFLSASTTTLQA